jgi:hypothetical protein
MPEFGRRLLVAGEADAYRADARKGCGFYDGVTTCKRTNAAGGLTHGNPPGFEVELNRDSGMGAAENYV